MNHHHRSIRMLPRTAARIGSVAGALLALGACSAGPDGEWSAGDLDTEAEQGGIVNGDTDNLPYHRARTVHVRTPPGGGCSGTLLLPDVVLTARHCVTTDSTINGTLDSASKIGARVLAVTPAPSAVDPCASDVTCARGSSIFELGGTSVDAVIVKLAEPINQTGTVYPLFTPLQLSGNDDGYVGTNLQVTGWGMGTCVGDFNVLRNGLMQLESTTGSSKTGGVIYTNLLQLDGNSSSQWLWKGDSGGPTWNFQTPPAVIGVHSTSDCDSEDTPHDSFDVSVSRNRTNLRAGLKSFTSNLSRNLSTLDHVSLPDPAGWGITNGKLTQSSNLASTVVVMKGVAYQRMVDLEHKVTVQGSDDDYAGLAIGYWPGGNSYLRCDASEQNDHVRLVARIRGTDTVLSSTSWSGDYGTAVNFSVKTQLTNGQYRISCSVSGGGASTATTASTYNDLTAGQVGVYNDFNSGAAYSNFSVTKL